MSATIIRSGPPLSSEQLDEVEQRMGSAIPPVYREFLLQNNGGRPVPNAFLYRRSDGTTAGEGGVNTFLGIGDAESTDIEWHRSMYEDRIPSNFFPIADDPGGNLICLSTSGDDVGAVYFWDHEEESDPPTYDNVYFIAPDFQTFLDTLFEAT